VESVTAPITLERYLLSQRRKERQIYSTSNGPQHNGESVESHVRRIPRRLNRWFIREEQSATWTTFERCVLPVHSRDIWQQAHICKQRMSSSCLEAGSQTSNLSSQIHPHPDYEPDHSSSISLRISSLGLLACFFMCARTSS